MDNVCIGVGVGVGVDVHHIMSAAILASIWKLGGVVGNGAGGGGGCAFAAAAGGPCEQRGTFSPDCHLLQEWLP